MKAANKLALPDLLNAIPGPLPVATHSNRWPLSLPPILFLHPPSAPSTSKHTAHLCEIQCDQSAGLCPAWHSLHICVESPQSAHLCSPSQGDRMTGKQTDIYAHKQEDRWDYSALSIPQTARDLSGAFLKVLTSLSLIMMATIWKKSGNLVTGNSYTGNTNSKFSFLVVSFTMVTKY